MGAFTTDVSLMGEAAPRILLLDEEPGDYAETIFWHDASRPARPDADLTVLLMTTDESMPIQQGWWDADSWCLCESGGFAAPGSVLAWAEVKGPEMAPNVRGEPAPTAKETHGHL